MTNALVADTSLIINFFNGHTTAREVLLNKSIWISGITEIEALASPKLTSKERAVVKEFLLKLYSIDLIKPVKELAIQLRIEKKLKISDAIIAATAIYLNLPLYTYDADFKRLGAEAQIVLIDL